MNNSFLRMKKLLEGIGLSFEEHGISYAELYAYSVGLSLVENDIEEVEACILMESDVYDSVNKYAELLRLDKNRFTSEELMAEIIKRLSMKYPSSTAAEVEAAFLLIGSGLYSYEQNCFTAYGVKLDGLKELGKFIAAYTSCCGKSVYNGHGELLTFDEWDSIGYTFNGYDNLCLPFEILDGLRSDIFE